MVAVFWLFPLVFYLCLFYFVFVFQVHLLKTENSTSKSNRESLATKQIRIPQHLQFRAYLDSLSFAYAAGLAYHWKYCNKFTSFIIASGYDCRKVLTHFKILQHFLCHARQT